MKNVYAYTEPTPASGYPGFISVNQMPVPTEEAALSFTVRSSGVAQGSEVKLSKDQAVKLAWDIMAHFGSSHQRN